MDENVKPILTDMSTALNMLANITGSITEPEDVTKAIETLDKMRDQFTKIRSIMVINRI